jgi:hypothetical protein
MPHNNILQYCSSFKREKGGWINVLQEGQKNPAARPKRFQPQQAKEGNT